MSGGGRLAVAAAAAGVAGLGLVLGLAVVAGAGASASATESLAELAPATCVVSGPVPGLTAGQAANADIVVPAALAAGGENMRAAQIAVMTAMTESGLENLAYGTADSLGLFQQRPSQGWGTTAEIEDPAYAAGAFFKALVKIPHYAKLPVDQAAQDVQRSADGSAYDGKSMTAAHKTLPLGTVARVTNLVNGESVMVRITDRGPFSHGRVLDLSESAAKQIDLYRMGVARVKIEAYANGTTAAATGRWCVQTGAFKKEQDALALKSALTRRYAGSRVIEFAGATGYWVRIDPVRHDHADAAAIMDWIGSPDPQAVPYLVRVN